MKDQLTIDFINDKINYQRKSHRGKNELIAKALGLGKGIDSVVDLTCGLAEDAFFLCQLGFHVLAIERSKELFEILERAYAKAIHSEPDNVFLLRLKIRFDDSIKYLNSIEFKQSSKRNLALYIDPMFPISRKTAKPRKQMQIFRELIGEDSDSHELLALALTSGVSRVVVKRPLKSDFLIKTPLHSFEGRTIRYDLYSGNLL